MSKRLARQLGRATDGRGQRAEPVRRPRVRTREQRLNRILLIGGGGLALGAVLLWLLGGGSNPVALGVDLAAIVVGLLMGKLIGRFMFRRVLPTGK